MKVAIDISPLKSGHKFRGIGIYTKNLVEALSLIKAPNFSIQLIESEEVPKDCDLVHYPYFDFFFLTLPFKKTKPTVVTIHDCTPLVFPKRYPPGLKGKLKFLIQKFSLKGAKRIITDSCNSKKDIVRFLGIPEQKIDVILLAAGNKVKRITDKNFLAKLRKKFNLPQKFVLYVGDVNYNKNLPGLVKACRLVKVPLVIVGRQAVQKDFDSTHPENQSLVELLNLVKGRSDVLRLGFVEERELAGLYSLASVYCQPSFYEGFGMQVLEAMKCGCPVVTSDVSSLPEVVGKAALLVNPYKIEEIAKSLNIVLTDEKLRKKLIKLGLEQEKKFSWERTAGGTIKVYEKVLERK